MPELRANGTNEIGWKHTKIVLNSEGLDLFSLLTNRRDLRKGNVNKLKRLLVAGKHFETPLVCNKVKNKYRLIDGNHRVTAIELFLEEYPQRRVEVAICYYEDLTLEQEKEMYTTWNLGTKQNMSDFIKQHWDSIWITRKLDPPFFPCKIRHSWSTGNLPFKDLISPYVTRNTPGSGFQGNCQDFIESAKELGDKDAIVLKAFMREYIEIFGIPDRSNTSYKATCFMTAARIWFRNHTRFKPDIMKKRMQKLRGHERSIYWATQPSNRSSNEQCNIDFLNVLNRGVKLDEMKMV